MLGTYPGATSCRFAAASSESDDHDPYSSSGRVTTQRAPQRGCARGRAFRTLYFCARANGCARANARTPRTPYDAAPGRMAAREQAAAWSAAAATAAGRARANGSPPDASASLLPYSIPPPLKQIGGCFREFVQAQRKEHVRFPEPAGRAEGGRKYGNRVRCARPPGEAPGPARRLPSGRGPEAEGPLEPRPARRFLSGESQHGCPRRLAVAVVSSLKSDSLSKTGELANTCAVHRASRSVEPSRFGGTSTTAQTDIPSEVFLQ